MGTIFQKYGKTIVLLLAATVLTIPASARKYADDMHVVIDWQMNAPLNSGFTSGISGWGMNFEGLFDVTPNFTVGTFVNFHTNHEYFGRQAIPLSPTETLTTDRQNSAFQLPFGLSGAVNFVDHGRFIPYFGVKTGAMFARNTSYYNVYYAQDKSWGYYVSPEIGIRIYPAKTRHFGFHVAGFYNVATNKSQVLSTDIDNQSNIGFRVGVFF